MLRYSGFRLFVAESYSRNIGKLKDAESGRLTVWDGIRNNVKYGRSILRLYVFGLGEEAELTAHKMKVAQMFNTPQQLHSSTSAAFLPNPCYGLPFQDNALGGLCKTHN